MAKKIFEALKKHGFIPKDLPADKLAEVEADFDAIEDSLAAQKTPPKNDSSRDTKTGEPSRVELPQEVLSDIEALKTSVTEITSGLKLVVDATKATAAERSVAEKEAQVKRYTDHVKKLADEGRITKAQHDEYLKSEKQDVAIKALDLFIETTSAYPVQPALARGQKTPETKGAPAGEGKPALPAIGGEKAAERKAVEDAALQELIDSMS
jgi:uncharacterized protein YutE (UPF0331/DUF86 family)